MREVTYYNIALSQHALAPLWSTVYHGVGNDITEASQYLDTWLPAFWNYMTKTFLFDSPSL